MKMYFGIIMHVLAKCAFVLGSYVMHYFLGKVLSPTDYGIVGTIITIINFEYLILQNGVRQAVSNTLSQEKYNHNDVIKKGVTVQSTLILLIMFITICFSPILGKLIGDSTFIKYINITAAIVPFMGIYFLLLGILNGSKHFIMEALILIIYPILKLSVIIFIKYNVFSSVIVGTEMGFLFAAIAIMFLSLLISLIMVRKIRYLSQKITWKDFIKKSLNFSIIFIAASIIMNIDLLIVKILLTNGAYAGYYAGAVNFAKVPYYLLNAVFIVILPIFTSLYSKKEYERITTTINNILELILSLVMPIVVLVTATSGPLLKTFYTPEYAMGKNALALLSWGMFFLGTILLLNMIISATGRKRFTVLFSIFILITDIIICPILTKLLSITGAAMSNFICSCLGMIISLCYVSKKIGRIEWTRKFKIIALNGLFMAVVFRLSIFLVPGNLVILVLFYGLSYVTFIGLEIVLKLIPISSMKKYVNK